MESRASCVIRAWQTLRLARMWVTLDSRRCPESPLLWTHHTPSFTYTVTNSEMKPTVTMKNALLSLRWSLRVIRFVLTSFSDRLPFLEINTGVCEGLHMKCHALEHWVLRGWHG